MRSVLGGEAACFHNGYTICIAYSFFPLDENNSETSLLLQKWFYIKIYVLEGASENDEGKWKETKKKRK